MSWLRPLGGTGIQVSALGLGTVKLGRETAGRKGKGVTVVWELTNLHEDGMKELCTRLKNRCGSGGTLKDGRIEIPTNRIRSRERAPSAMPEGLTEMISRAELRDLIEALAR